MRSVNSASDYTPKELSILARLFFVPFIIILLIFSILIVIQKQPGTAEFVINKNINNSGKANISIDSAPYFKYEPIPQPAFLLASHAATLEVLPNGNLIALWFAGSHEGKPDVKIWQSIYDGEQWGMATVAVSPARIGYDTKRFIKKVGNPVVYLEQNGKLHLFVVSVGIGGWSGSSLNHFVSINNGMSWEPAEKLILSPFLNISTLDRTRAISLADGGFYLPVYHEFMRTYPELLRFDQNGQFIREIRLNAHNNLLQPALLPLTDKDALVYMRNNGRHDNILYYQQTHDGGLTWSATSPTNLTNQDSSLVVSQVQPGKYIMLHNIDKREKLALAVSSDGTSWRDIFLLENQPDGEFSYPAIQVHDGIIDILYTQQRKDIKHVRFNLAWLEQQERGSINVE